MSSVYEDVRRMEPVKEYAGLFSWFKKLKFRFVESEAGSPETDAYDRQEPSFGQETTTTTEGPTVSESLRANLLSSIAKIWQQKTVDPVAFERIKDLKVEPSKFPGTMALVNDENDIIYFGINPQDGSHAVMSPANISARHALDQVYVALTDDLMRAEGVDDVDGTDLDKALLCLAAEKNGLKINNMPVLSDEVKAQALKLWQEAYPEETPAPATGPAVSASGAENVIKAEVTDILAAKAPDAPLATKTPGEVIDAKAKDVTPVGTLEAPQAATGKTQLPEVIIMGYTPDTAADTPAAATTLNAATLDILRGNAPEEAVAPEAFISFMDELKGGKFSDDQGMLAEDTIRATFNRTVGNGTESDFILRAAVSQGFIYGTTKTVPALRMLVNPHVVSPVRYNPNKLKPAP